VNRFALIPARDACRLALRAAVANWSLTSLQQRLVKTGGRLIKTRPLLLVAAGGEPPDVAAVWRHAAQDRDGGVASGIRPPFLLSSAQDSHVRSVEFFCHSRARVWRARGIPNSAGARGERPGFFARRRRARMTEQEIEQDRNCHCETREAACTRSEKVNK